MKNTNQLQIQLNEVFEAETKEIKRTMSNAQDTVAKQAIQMLKEKSPRRRPEFYKGWSIKRERTNNGIPDVILYNKTHPGLTHLLNNGHVVMNGKGRVGDYKGSHFMEDVERWANEELPREIERELQ